MAFSFTRVSDRASERVSERVSEWVSERVSEGASERVLDRLSQRGFHILLLLSTFHFPFSVNPGEFPAAVFPMKDVMNEYESAIILPATFSSCTAGVPSF